MNYLIKNKELPAAIFYHSKLIAVMAIALISTAHAQTYVAPTLAYANSPNVDGYYESGQAVCDARKALTQYPHPSIFVPFSEQQKEPGNTFNDGACVSNNLNVAWPQHGYYCPSGYSLRYTSIVHWPQNGKYGLTGATGAKCELIGIDLGKSAGQLSCPAAVTQNPISLSSGNKLLVEVDIQSGGLLFDRSFNGLLPTNGLDPMQRVIRWAVGANWAHRYSSKIKVESSDVYSTAWVTRHDGKTLGFNLASGNWQADSDIADRLLELKDTGGVRIGWRYYAAGTQQYETYDAGGVLQSIQLKDNNQQTIHYSDGTDGVISGKGGFVLDTAGVPTTALLPAGLLLRVTGSFGRSLQFAYDASGHIIQLTDNTGSLVRYSYDTAGNLSTVTYPDGKTKTYLYGETAYTSGTAQPNALTGVLDENNTRTITYWYDAQGRAYDEKLAGDVGRNQLAYSVNGSGNVTSTAVTDALGAVRTYNFTNILGVNRLASVDQPGGSGCGAASSAITYDANGNTASRTDFNNAKTCSAYDLTRNLEGVRVEGLAGAAACPTDLAGYSIPTPAAGASVSVRKVTTAWHPAWRLESRRAEPKLISTSVYNGQIDPTNVGAGPVSCAPATATVTDVSGAAIPIAVLCRKIEQATTDETGSLGFSATPIGNPRIWNTTYNQYGQVLTEDGPRLDVADVTSYEYYTNTVFDAAGVGHTMGDLWKVTNAAGQVTETTFYDKAGRVLESKDANGVLTQMTYWPRGWLKSQSTVVGSVTQTTLYDYDGVGQLKKVTQPDGSFTAYDYDDAHRLTDIRDNLNNSIHYVLDPAGNRTSEQIKDPAGVLKRTTTRIFDQLGRLQNVVVQ